MKHLALLLLPALTLSACQFTATPDPAPPSPDPEPTRPPAAAASPTADPFAIFTATLPAPATGTPTRVPPEMRVSPADGMPAVFVPQGSVLMGGLDVNAENDEHPQHDVQVGAFWIDQLEVTNGMYGLCVQAGVCRPPVKTGSQSRFSYFDNPEFRDYPVVQVAWQDAAAYCEWAGRRLPTEAEWERAARGDDTRTYPWGDELPGEGHANFDNRLRDTSRVGSYAAGASPFGALDMAGNVWEWTRDAYDLDFYKDAPEVDPVSEGDPFFGIRRVIRGGSFQDTWLDLRVSNRGYDFGPDPGAAYGSVEAYGRSSVKIGFRCASDP